MFKALAKLFGPFIVIGLVGVILFDVGSITGMIGLIVWLLGFATMKCFLVGLGMIAVGIVFAVAAFLLGKRAAKSIVQASTVAAAAAKPVENAA